MRRAFRTVKRIEFFIDHGLLLLLVFGSLVLSACGNSSDQIVSAVRKSGSSEYIFTLNNPGNGAEINISFPELVLQSDVDFSHYFKAKALEPSHCTVTTDVENNSYDVSFMSDVSDCDIALASIVKSTVTTTGTIQFSASGRHSRTYSYTNGGYLMAVAEGQDDPDSSNYHDSSWSTPIETDVGRVFSQPLATALNGTVYVSSYYDGEQNIPDFSIYTYDEGWQTQPQVPGLRGVYALAIGTDGSTLYAGGIPLSSETWANFNTYTNSSWGEASASGMLNIHAIAMGADGAVYAGGEAFESGGVDFNTYANSAWKTASYSETGEIYTLTMGADGILYAAGNPTSDLYNFNTYDTATETWGTPSSASEDGVGYVYASAISIDGSTVYVGGIADDFNTYDTATGTWGIAQLVDGLDVIYALVVGTDGTVYAGGTEDSEDDNPTDFSIYANGDWERKSSPLSSIAAMTFFNVLNIEASN